MGSRAAGSPAPYPSKAGALQDAVRNLHDSGTMPSRSETPKGTETTHSQAPLQLHQAYRRSQKTDSGSHSRSPTKTDISADAPYIPGRTEHRVSEIIKRKRRNPQEIDPDVQSGLVDQLLLRI